MICDLAAHLVFGQNVRRVIESSEKDIDVFACLRGAEQIVSAVEAWSRAIRDLIDPPRRWTLPNPRPARGVAGCTARTPTGNVSGSRRCKSVLTVASARSVTPCGFRTNSYSWHGYWGLFPTTCWSSRRS